MSATSIQEFAINPMVRVQTHREAGGLLESGSSHRYSPRNQCRGDIPVLETPKDQLEQSVTVPEL